MAGMPDQTTIGMPKGQATGDPVGFSLLQGTQHAHQEVWRKRVIPIEKANHRGTAFRKANVTCNRQPLMGVLDQAKPSILFRKGCDNICGLVC